MPIKVRCQCGKTLNAPDAALGKAVKCPGCGKPVRVSKPGTNTSPAKGSQSAAKSAAKSMPASTAIGDDDIGSLFDEEGFSAKVESVCPSCRVEMPAAAVLCTKCGFNRQTGEQLQRHLTAGVDIDQGTMALEKASKDMEKEKTMQAELIKGGGMPWWALVMIMVIGGGALGIATLGVNSANAETEGEAMTAGYMMALLVTATMSVASLAAFLKIVVHAAKQSIVQGLLTFFVPMYIFYHVATNWKATGKTLIAAIVFSVVGSFVWYYANAPESTDEEQQGGGINSFAMFTPSGSPHLPASLESVAQSVSLATRTTACG